MQLKKYIEEQFWLDKNIEYTKLAKSLGLKQFIKDTKNKVYEKKQPKCS